MPRKIMYKPVGSLEWAKAVRNANGNGKVVVDRPVDDAAPDGTHTCLALAYENEKRVKEGASPVHVFQDIENCMWNIRVGLEFIETRFCAFCGETLC